MFLPCQSFRLILLEFQCSKRSYDVIGAVGRDRDGVVVWVIDGYWESLAYMVMQRYQVLLVYLVMLVCQVIIKVSDNL